MTASSSESKWIGGYLLWLLAATAIGALLSSLAGAQFQHHVRVFYGGSTANSKMMHFIADVAVGVHPFALCSPALGPIYYCWRNGLATTYLVMCATPAAIIGWSFSPFIQGVPDQPYSFIVPVSVFVATIVALFIQAIRKDWIDHEAPRSERPKHFSPPTQC